MEVLNEVWKVHAESEYLLTLLEPNQWFRADIKWDGCVHFYRSHNNTPLDIIKDLQNVDYIHICDIDDMILRLQELKRLATAHFKNEYWEDSK